MKLLLVFALTAAALNADVQYYLSDKLTSIDPSKWSVTGNVLPGASGLAAPDANGGTLISKITPPDGTSEAEVYATIALATSGGVFTEFVQATSDSRTANLGSGSYLAFEMQNPKFDTSGHCMANFVLLQSTAGTVSVVSTFQYSCRNGMVMRLALHGTTALVWVDQQTPIEFPISPTGGQPGIGSYGTPAGNSIALVRLGSISRAIPAALDSKSIGVSSFRNHTDVQWRPPAVDPNGPGLWGYFIYRDGEYLMRNTATHFTDEAVSAGANHTYSIYVVDQHFNQSTAASVTAVTPAPTAKGK